MKKLFNTSLLILLFCIFSACKQEIDMSKNSNKQCYVTFSASNNSNSRQAGNYAQNLDLNNVKKIVIRYTDNFHIVKELKTWISDSTESAKTKMESDTNITLEAGIYTFNIELYEDENIFARGVIEDKEIVDGNNHLTFSVYLDNKGSTTPITLKFDWNYNTDNLSKALFGLYYLDRQNELVEGFQEEELVITNNSASFSKADFPCGNYLLKLDLFDSYEHKTFSYVDLLIANKAQGTINISLGNISGFSSISYENIDGLEFEDSSYSLPILRNTAEVLILPVCNDIKNPPTGKILLGWYDKDVPDKTYTVIPKSVTKDLTLCPKWESTNDNEIFCSVSELATYLISENSSKIIYITDKDPDLTSINSNIKSKTVSVNLSLKYCTELRVFPNTLSGNTYITSITLPDSVSSIQNEAFKGCTEIVKATFPDSDIKFGKDIFSGCTKINPENVKLPESLSKLPEGFYRNCTNLTSVTIPDNIEIIGNSCFAGCSNLTSVNFSENSNIKEIGGDAFNSAANLEHISIPESVNKIGVRCFYGCSSVTSITLPSLINEIPSGTFYNCTSLSSVNIPNTITSIGNGAFYATNISGEIIIPDTVTSIGDSAFSKTKISKIEIPDTVTEIGASCFQSCYSLASVRLSQNLKTINDMLFRGCNILEEVNIPDSIEELGEYCFLECKKLATIKLSSHLTTIGDYALNGNYFTELEIPENVTTIGEYAFGRSYKLVTLTIPDSVTEIGQYAFHSSPELTYLKLSANIETIPQYIINNCNKLETLIFPDKLKTIVAEAFYNHNNIPALKNIELPDTVETIGDKAFYNSSIVTINIKEGTSNFSIENTNGTGIGYQCFFNSKNINTVVIPKAIKIIGEEAFYKTQLESVTLPDTITSIGIRAFSSCTNLKKVLISDVGTGTDDCKILGTAFGGCSKLETVTLPSCTTELYDSAFSGCSILTSVSVSSKGKNTNGCYIRDKCFQNCPKLKKLVLSGPLKQVGEYAFEKTLIESVTLSDNLEGIGQYAFNECTDLSSVNIIKSEDEIINHEGEIGNNAFYKCSALAKMDFPASLKTIGNSAFSNCSSLINVNFPASLESVGKSAFFSCSSLVSADFGAVKNECITNTSTNIFAYCYNLQSFIFPEKIVTIPESAFRGCNLSNSDVLIPNTVTSIGDNAFSDCKYDKEIIIPNSVTSIGNSAFYDCKKTPYIVIPETVTSISGSYTFYNVSLIDYHNYHGSLDNAPWYALNYNPGKRIIPETATCSSSGTGKVVCSLCQKYYETINVDKSEHYLDENSKCIFCNNKYVACFWEKIPKDYSWWPNYTLVDIYKWKSYEIDSYGNAIDSWTITVPEDCTYPLQVAVNGYYYFAVTLDEEEIIRVQRSEKKTIEIQLTKGTHTIKARYQSTGTSTSGEECGYITLNPVYVPID